MAEIDLKTGLARFFEQDHRDCEARWADIEELLDTEDIETARPAWEKFDASIRRHMAMEEEVLFPALGEIAGKDGDESTAAMTDEHQQMKGLLEEIRDAMDAGDNQKALDAGDTFLMLFQQHNVKEESLFYPMSENVLGGDWRGLAEKLEEF